MSSRKTLLTVGILAALAGGIAWYARRGEPRAPAAASSAKAAAEPRAEPAPLPSADTPEGADLPARRPRARRLADPLQRDQLLEAIRQARQRRAGTAATRGAPRDREAAEVETEVAADEAEYIRESVRDIIPLLVECYEQAIERAPALAGKVVVDFTIEGEPEIGGVIGASEIADGTTIDDAELHECISETMYAIEIEPPAQGGTIHVTYPFEFRNAPPDDE